MNKEMAKAGVGEYYALNVFAHKNLVCNYMSNNVYTLYPIAMHALQK